MKKNLAIILFALLLSLSLVSAVNLEIEKKTIAITVISEFNNPAVFELTITNNGGTDNFEFYSLVGVDILPKTPVKIESGEIKKIKIEVFPQEPIKSESRPYTFEYKIKGEKTGIQTEKLTINPTTLESAFSLYADPFTPLDEKIILHFDNKGDYNFEKINAEFSSSFFSENKEFPITPHEKKEFEIKINKEEISTLLAGPYLLNAKIETNSKKASIDSIIKFLEKSGIESSETKEGWLIQRTEIEKKNSGNTPQEITVTFKKNLFSSLFTSFNIIPTNKETSRFTRYYTWQKKVAPGESFRMIARTNWLLPVIILIAIIAAYILTKAYLTSHLILRKKVSFVKTRGGEFALKVVLRLKSRKYIEKIRIVDKLPPMVKLFERFGAISPDKIDETNRRIEWDIESLNKGEERTVSYIIYSKIGIIGKFELPSATAIYETEGVVKETSSNRAFFVNEPLRKSEQQL